MDLACLVCSKPTTADALRCTCGGALTTTRQVGSIKHLERSLVKHKRDAQIGQGLLILTGALAAVTGALSAMPIAGAVSGILMGLSGLCGFGFGVRGLVRTGQTRRQLAEARRPHELPPARVVE